MSKVFTSNIIVDIEVVRWVIEPGKFFVLNSVFPELHVGTLIELSVGLLKANYHNENECNQDFHNIANLPIAASFVCNGQRCNFGAWI